MSRHSCRQTTRWKREKVYTVRHLTEERGMEAMVSYTCFLRHGFGKENCVSRHWRRICRTLRLCNHEFNLNDVPFKTTPQVGPPFQTWSQEHVRSEDNLTSPTQLETLQDTRGGESLIPTSVTARCDGRGSALTPCGAWSRPVGRTLQ